MLWKFLKGIYNILIFLSFLSQYLLHSKLSFVEKLDITEWGAAVEEAALFLQEHLISRGLGAVHHCKLPAQIK